MLIMIIILLECYLHNARRNLGVVPEKGQCTVHVHLFFSLIRDGASFGISFTNQDELSYHFKLHFS
jgi:hypothetical protein